MNRRLLHTGNRTEIELIAPSGEASYVLKRLRPFADVSTERSALRREAMLQHLARGEGVVTILGGAEKFDGASFDEGESPEWRVLKRAYVNAPTLAEVVRTSGTLSEKESLLLGGRLARILQHLHELDPDFGIIHRDITPTNVYLCSSGELLLSDFGIARLTNDPPLGDDELLQGARRFLAPELHCGIAPSSKSDIYQLGLLILWLQNPMAATSPRVTAHLPEIVRASLAERPDERPTARELAAHLVMSAAS